MHAKQRTMARPVGCSGIGLHSGKPVTLKIKPAPVNHGIQFKRTDLQDSPCIPALFNRVVDTSLATVLGHEGFIVSTIEHLMASLAGLSIDNALVELDAYWCRDKKWCFLFQNHGKSAASELPRRNW